MFPDIANVFDLLGRVILIMINGKIFLQLLWVEGARWDENRFQQFCNQNGKDGAGINPAREKHKSTVIISRK